MLLVELGGRGRHFPGHSLLGGLPKVSLNRGASQMRVGTVTTPVGSPEHCNLDAAAKNCIRIPVVSENSNEVDFMRLHEGRQQWFRVPLRDEDWSGLLGCVYSPTTDSFSPSSGEQSVRCDDARELLKARSADWLTFDSEASRLIVSESRWLTELLV